MGVVVGVVGVDAVDVRHVAAVDALERAVRQSWEHHARVHLDALLVVLAVGSERYVLPYRAAVRVYLIVHGAPRRRPHRHLHRRDQEVRRHAAPPLAPERHAYQHVVHQRHLVGLGALYHVAEGLVATLQCHVDVAVRVNVGLVCEAQVAQQQRQAAYPQACPSLVELLVQPRPVHVARRSEDVGVGADVEREGVAPRVAAGEDLRGVGHRDPAVLRQCGIGAPGAVAVEYLKRKMFHTECF